MATQLSVLVAGLDWTHVAPLALTYFQSATSSFRASATIVVLRRGERRGDRKDDRAASTVYRTKRQIVEVGLEAALSEEPRRAIVAALM